jgi:hypothetical protein
MDTIKKYAPIIGAFLMFAAVFFLFRKNKSVATEQKSQILERAREAKLAKSILKKEEDDAESIPL